MGVDKALLNFGGQKLIQQVLSRLDSLAQETIITTNHPEGYRFLELPLIPDIIPDRGALGGLYTALQAATQPLVAIVACDMPFANPDILRTCRDLLVVNHDLDAAIPSTERGMEPLHAVYRRESCLKAVKDAINADQLKMISWHKDVNVRVLSPDEITQLDPKGLAFENINTLDEYKTAIRWMNQSTGH